MCFYVVDSVIDNTRYKALSFKITIDSVLHGFTGYFETVLYKDVMLSINPSTYSKGMVSWFPIFFPIRVCIIFVLLNSYNFHELVKG